MHEALDAQTDGELITQVLGGDRDSFREIVHRYLPLVLAALRFRGLNRADSVEITGEAFVRSFTALGELREPGALGARLYEISTNEALNFHHRRRPTTVYSREKVREPSTPLGRVERILKSAARIPGEHRDIFLQKHRGGLDCASIARRTGLPLELTRTRLRHAYELLDAELGLPAAPLDEECLQLRHALLLHRAGEEPAEQARLLGHLRGCEVCQGERERFGHLLELLPAVAAAEDEELDRLQGQIFDAIELLPLPRTENLWPTRLVWVAVVVSGAALVLALWGVLGVEGGG
jgi:RNA polymerase sigma-70 factor (ECF subfamily)